MSILSNLEKLTNQSNLKAGITDFDDAVFLVETLPSATKNTLLRQLNLDGSTTNTQLANLIIAEKEGKTIETQEIPNTEIDIETIDDEPLGQNITDNELKNLIEEDFEDDGDTEGQGKSEGKREGEGEGEGQGDGEKEGEGEGEAEFEEDGESEGEGGKDGEGEGEGEGGKDAEGEAEGEDKGKEQSEEEKNQEDKVRNELLEYGYQPPYFFLTPELIEKGELKKTTKYVEIVKKFEKQRLFSTTKYSVVIIPRPDNFFVLAFYFAFKQKVNTDINDSETSQFVVDFAVNYTSDVNSGAKELFNQQINTSEKSMFSNLFNKAYGDAIKIFNTQLIEEAEKNQKFIENINK